MYFYFVSCISILYLHPFVVGVASRSVPPSESICQGFIGRWHAPPPHLATHLQPTCIPHSTALLDTVFMTTLLLNIVFFFLMRTVFLTILLLNIVFFSADNCIYDFTAYFSSSSLFPPHGVTFLDIICAPVKVASICLIIPPFLLLYWAFLRKAKFYEIVGFEL